jgi:glutamine amidotransferase
MRIVIVDYGMGNLGSISNMLKKVGAPAVISADPDTIARADKLILPGIGAFDNGIRNLKARGLLSVLTAHAVERRKPMLGVCLGMQLLTRRSEEGVLPGLGWLDAETVRFKFAPEHQTLKIPHMGWNTLTVRQPHQLFADMEDENRFYFVHSYHVACADQSNVLAQTTYGFDFASAVVRNNIMGVQFHPEKSHRFGMQLLKNFAERM